MTPVIKPKNMAQAYFAPSELKPLDQAINRISASIVRVYPPGIPILWPGRLITVEIIEDLQSAHKAGQTIIGVNMGGRQEISVKI